jgi:hypothetical protein
MSCNVRQPDLDDGSNGWEQRKDLWWTSRDCQPDLIGTQEPFVIQVDYLIERTLQYSWFGTGRFGDSRDKT